MPVQNSLNTILTATLKPLLIKGFVRFDNFIFNFDLSIDVNLLKQTLA